MESETIGQEPESTTETTAPTEVELTPFDAWEVRGHLAESNRLKGEVEMHERAAEAIIAKACVGAGCPAGKGSIVVDAETRRVVWRRA